MIASAGPGRVRLREARMRGPQVGEIAGALRSQPGILEAIGNPRTGSVLVRFDEGATTPKAIAEQARGMLPPEVARPRANPPLSARALAKRGMALSLGAAVVALLFSEKAHAVLGGTFLIAAAAHIHQNRRTFLRR